MVELFDVHENGARNEYRIRPVDGEDFSVSGEGKDLQYLLEIFRNLRPADEN